MEKRREGIPGREREWQEPRHRSVCARNKWACLAKAQETSESWGWKGNLGPNWVNWIWIQMTQILPTLPIFQSSISFMHTGKGKLREIGWLTVISRPLLFWLSGFGGGSWLTIPPRTLVWWHTWGTELLIYNKDTSCLSVWTMCCQIEFGGGGGME